jgi:hypothetical protein
MASYARTLYGSNYGMSTIKDAICNHSMVVFGVIILLIIIVIVLMYYMHKYKKKCTEGFISAVNNMTTGNNNPQWQYGAMDAGNWGPMHRDPNEYNVAVFHPSWRAGGACGKEGMAERNLSSCGSIGSCTGSSTGNCNKTSPGPRSCYCGEHWNPSASIEAQALATAGVFGDYMMDPAFASQRMQNAVGSAIDPNKDINDDVFSTIMHSGNVP